MTKYILLLLFLYIIIQVFFKLAIHFNITDKPSDRGLHKKEIIRGGGIVLWFTYLYQISFVEKFDIAFFIGFSAISIISLLDDIKGLSVRFRFSIHVFSIIFLLKSLNLAYLNIFIFIFLIIFILSIINSFNFMDGINGITGLYAISSLFSMIYVNEFIIPFAINDELIFYSIGILLFLFYNLRKNAVCFCGDIGSIGVGFILVYFIFKLIIVSQDYKYLLFFALYGIDTLYTIVYRLRLKQNIFEPHKLHFYQILVYKYNLSHLTVSVLYFLIQIFINTIIISQNSYGLLYILPFGIIIGIVHYLRKKVALAISI